MLEKLPQKYHLQNIKEQVNRIVFDKQIAINETSGGLFNGPYTVKSEFKNTPLGDLLDSLGEIGEARLLKLSPGDSYMAHSDPDDRLHLNITGGEYSYILNLEENKMYTIPADGHLWRMDTGPIHVACNFGSKERIHLNIRILLPDIQEKYVRVTIEGGDFDWRHRISVSVSRWLNRAIKSKEITGFRKITDKEILVSYENYGTIEELKQIIYDAGFDCVVSSQ